MLRPLALFALLLPAALFAQPGGTDLIFKNLTERDGLPYRTATSIHIDRRGTVWLGTEQGLACYDAGALSTVKLLPGEPPPGIMDMAEDSAGVLWMATSNSLMRLHPRTREVARWNVPQITSVTGYPEALSNLFVGSDQRIYCTGLSGFFRFDPAEEKFHSITIPGDTARNYFNLLRADSANTGCWLNTDRRGLIYYKITTGVFIHKDNDTSGDPLFSGLNVSVFTPDEQGNIWLSDTKTREMIRYSPGDRSVRRWAYVPGHPDIETQAFSILAPDAQGRLWGCDYSYLPFFFDPVDSTARRVLNVDGDPGSICGNFISDLEVDADGNTWMATVNGVSVLPKEGFTYSSQRMVHLLDDRADMALFNMKMDDAGNVWMGTELGSIRYEIATRVSERVFVQPPPNQANNALDLIHVDGRLWTCSRDGLWRYDPRTKAASRFSNYPDDARHMERKTYAWIIQDAKGLLWAGTWGRGVVCIDPRADTCRFFKPDNTNEGALWEGVLVCGFVSRDGTLWIGHGNKGLMHYDAGKDRFVRHAIDLTDHGAIRSIVLAIKEDPSGRLWLGVKETGLLRFDPATGEHTLYGRAHGLRMPSVGTILQDKRGRVWVGTGSELACFDPQQERFITVPIDQGTDFDDFNTSSIELPSGEFLFANTNTVVRFDPLRFQVPPAPHAPSLREVRVYGERLPWLPGDTLLFGYKQDQLDLRFGTPTLPGGIATYSYLLDGVSREWTSNSTGIASFNNLEPGTYAFRMKVQDRWGTWSPESRSSFTIVPPWWKQLWARIAGAVLLAGAIVLVFRLRLEFIRKREREQETQARSMNELKLRALRAQMNPHFVFNSLNSIDRYIMGEDKKKASHYLNRFAKLIRLILQQSDRTTVPLDREVEMLNYYLELEALRFSTPFTYTVKVDPLLHDEPVELPAMLVQPFVENAIWHGLQHKEGQGHIEVTFRLVNDDLECTVEDNGIGRAASAEINAHRSGVHRSMGMSVTTDRIALLRSTIGRSAKITIHDLADREGMALGTRVTIGLPLAATEEEEQTMDHNA